MTTDRQHGADARARVARAVAANPENRIDAMAANISALSYRVGLAFRTNDAKRRARVDKWLAKFEAKVEEFVAEGKTLWETPVTPVRNEVDAAAAIVSAIESLAKFSGAVLLKPDGLQNLATVHAAPGDAEFLRAMPAPRLSSWLRRERGPHAEAVIEALKARDVLAWWEQIDDRHRLVHTRWLEAHADIFEFVINEPLRGRRCRFCQIDEQPSFADWVAVEQKDRHALSVLERGSERIVRLKVNIPYAHRLCLPYFNQWVSIARQYRSVEDAEAADQAAGRVRRERSHPPPSYVSDPQPPSLLQSGMQRVNPDMGAE